MDEDDDNEVTQIRMIEIRSVRTIGVPAEDIKSMRHKANIFFYTIILPWKSRRRKQIRIMSSKCGLDV